VKVSSLALSVALSLAACGGTSDDFLRGVAAGDRAKTAGRYDEAARAYHQAAVAAKRPYDRDEGLYLEAATYAEAGHPKEAMSALDGLIALAPKGDRTNRAIFDRAFLEIEHGDEAHGYAMLEDALFHHSESGSAQRAIKTIVTHEESKAKGGGRVWIDAHLQSLEKTEVLQDALYDRAKSLEDEGKLREARDAYVLAAKRFPYPSGPLTDDAWWFASIADEKLGDARAAIHDLEEMLAPREDSTLGQGSYERPRFPPGQKRIAELWRDQVHDDARARAAFHRLYTDFAPSVLRAEALFEEASLARKDGDDGATCSATRSLVNDFPESRYAGCASALCSSVAAPAKAIPCREYLLQRIAAGGVAAPIPSDDLPNLPRL
jgi:tetratricopeptide (TPR) repeat protein